MAAESVIDEEDQDYYNEIFMDELENGTTASLLDVAENFSKEFLEEYGEVPAVIQGYIVYKKPKGLLQKSFKRFFQIQASKGVFLKF